MDKDLIEKILDVIGQASDLLYDFHLVATDVQGERRLIPDTDPRDWASRRKLWEASAALLTIELRGTPESDKAEKKMSAVSEYPSEDEKPSDEHVRYALDINEASLRLLTAIIVDPQRPMLDRLIPEIVTLAERLEQELAIRAARKGVRTI